MILIGLGANVAGPWGNPRESVERALATLARPPFRLLRASRRIATAPMGQPNQPPYVNAVAVIETHLPPEALLRRLHAIERAAGRRRLRRWGPRTLDLDLLDYRGLVRRDTFPGAATPRPLVLPHPGIALRWFVLKPIAEIAPKWRHPLTRATAAMMLRRLGSSGAGGAL